MLLSILYRKENYNLKKLSKLNKVAQPLGLGAKPDPAFFKLALFCYPKKLLWPVPAAIFWGSGLTGMAMEGLSSRDSTTHLVGNPMIDRSRVMPWCSVHLSAFLRSLYPLLELSSQFAEMGFFSVIPLIAISIKSLLSAKHLAQSLTRISTCWVNAWMFVMPLLLVLIS